jgi:hypothetical protein
VSDTSISSISTIARETAEQVIDAAQDAIEGISQKVHPPPTKHHRKWPWVLLGLLALGAAVAWFARTRTEDFDTDYGGAPDAFGDAVLEEREASANGRMTVATPGA